ncbi:MAG: RluA family pseudouridine synthase [Chloroflexota bacterium]
MSIEVVVAGPSDAQSRLDVVVAGHLDGVSRSLAAVLAREGHIRVNGVPARPARHLNAGDRIEIELSLPPSISAVPEDIPLTIVYQNHDLAIIDKPAGLVVHPAAGHASGTLANALAHRFPASREVGDESRPGIVHRLDKDTSGLMVVALNSGAHAALQEQIASRVAKRVYLALAQGMVKPADGIIEGPVGRHPSDRKRMAVHGIGARPARTAYRTVEALPGFTLLELTLDTGRTHQIRVHLASLGYPIAGDSVYGGPGIEGLSRQFLHAHRLSLDSPGDGSRLEFVSPLPDDLARVLDSMRFRTG